MSKAVLAGPRALPRHRGRATCGHCRYIRIGQATVRPDGSIRWAKVTVSPVLDPSSGRIVRTLGAFQDVTEQKADAERQLLLAREVDHRAKNSLAVVVGVLRLTPSDDPEVYARSAGGR
jgi:hypothetical protein